MKKKPNIPFLMGEIYEQICPKKIYIYPISTKKKKKMVISLVIRKIQIIIRYNFAFTGMTKSKKIKGYSDQKNTIVTESTIVTA